MQRVIKSIEKKGTVDFHSLINWIRDFFINCFDGKYEIEIQKIGKNRTSQQNRALHKYFELLAEALNDAGYDMRKTLREDIEIPWTAETIKENLWRPCQKAYLRKESTTQLQTDEIDKIYDIINREIGQRTGVSVMFPSIEQLMESEKLSNNL